MLRRWLANGLDPASITVIDPGMPPLPDGVQLRAVPDPDATRPDTIVLAVKPQQLGDAQAMLAGFRPRLLLSILAGVPLSRLATAFGAAATVRAMPNLPVAIGAGVVALASDGSDPDVRDAAEALMKPLGLVEWVPEAMFDAVTALAGSGPGFLFRFIDALADAGSALGLPRDQAARFALATVAGSAQMARDAEVSPAVLADRVASKGGSTREGLNVLDADRALVDLLTRTLRAAERRNRELGAG